MPGQVIDFTPAPVGGLEIRHKPPALKALTPLRFLAAMHVVLFHENMLLPLRSQLWIRFVNAGYTGVTFFFVLSGFILAYNYPTLKNRFEFWSSRFARIYPLYLFSLLLSLVLALRLGLQQHLPTKLLLTISLLQAWFPGWAFALNTPAWTLSVEAFFYGVFPFAVRLISRNPLRSAAVISSVYLGVWSLPAIVGTMHGTAASAFPLSTQVLEGPFPLFRLPAFLIGVATGLMFLHRGRHRLRSTRIALGFGIVSATALLLAAPGPLLLPLRTAALAQSYALVSFGLAPVRARLLTHPLSQLAGEISFGIYILQAPVIRAVSFALRHVGVLQGPVSVFISVAVLLFTSWLTYRYIEVPARLAIRQALTHKRVPVRPL
jgi:peptidoglycan/LPS O-acetylase OafA/YrhL